MEPLRDGVEAIDGESKRIQPCIEMGIVGLKRAAIDPSDLTRPAIHFLIHMCGAAGTIAPTTVPETDELHLTDAV